MSKVYSALLAEGIGEVGGGRLEFAPASGYVWVIRDIVAYAPLSDGTVDESTFGFDIQDSAGISIYSVKGSFARVGFPYHWEGRQVIEPEDLVYIWTYDQPWQFRISGYNLTLP